MAQHYVPHGGYNALCGEHMLGRRNSRLDEDPEATTCKDCLKVLAEQQEDDAPADTSPGTEYLMADAAYDVRGFADDGDIDGHLMDAYDMANGGDYEGWD